MTHKEWVANARACELATATLYRKWLVSDDVQADCTITLNAASKATAVEWNTWQHNTGSKNPAAADDIAPSALRAIADLRQHVSDWVRGRALRLHESSK